jgi:hypothetical protein
MRTLPAGALGWGCGSPVRRTPGLGGAPVCWSWAAASHRQAHNSSQGTVAQYQPCTSTCLQTASLDQKLEHSYELSHQHATLNFIPSGHQAQRWAVMTHATWSPLAEPKPGLCLPCLGAYPDSSAGLSRAEARYPAGQASAGRAQADAGLCASRLHWTPYRTIRRSLGYARHCSRTPGRLRQALDMHQTRWTAYAGTAQGLTRWT